MGVALYPVLEHPIEGLNPELEISGKSFSHNQEILNEICTQLGVKQLMDFYSESKEETIAHLGEDPDEELSVMLDKIPLQWFNPSDGLITAQTLAKYLATKSEDWVPHVLEDLQALELVLLKAQQAKTRFRLRIDM